MKQKMKQKNETKNETKKSNMKIRFYGFKKLGKDIFLKRKNGLK